MPLQLAPKTDWGFNPLYVPPPIFYDDVRFMYDDSRITYDDIVLVPAFTTVMPTNWSE
jgi:hypothetical protein